MSSSGSERKSRGEAVKSVIGGFPESVEFRVQGFGPPTTRVRILWGIQRYYEVLGASSHFRVYKGTTVPKKLGNSFWGSYNMRRVRVCWGRCHEHLGAWVPLSCGVTI